MISHTCSTCKETRVTSQYNRKHNKHEKLQTTTLWFLAEADQGFARGGHQPIIRLHFFPKTAWKWRKLDWEGSASKILLCRSATARCAQLSSDRMLIDFIVFSGEIGKNKGSVLYEVLWIRQGTVNKHKSLHSVCWDSVLPVLHHKWFEMDNIGVKEVPPLTYILSITDSLNHQLSKQTIN